MDTSIVRGIIQKFARPTEDQQTAQVYVSLTEAERNQLPFIKQKLLAAKQEKKNTGAESAGTGLSTKDALKYLEGFDMKATNPRILLSRRQFGLLANKLASAVLDLPSNEWPYRIVDSNGNDLTAAGGRRTFARRFAPVPSRPMSRLPSPSARSPYSRPAVSR
jgi:hypothetical protein